MLKPSQRERSSQLVNVTTTVPRGRGGSTLLERRNLVARRALLDRIHGEFLEMRGLSVTVAQAAKLFGLPVDTATRVLGQLAEAQVLRRRHDGQFALKG